MTESVSIWRTIAVILMLGGVNACASLQRGTDADTPPECTGPSGGTFGHPGLPARVREGTRGDATLGPNGALTFVITSARTGRPLDGAYVYDRPVSEGDSGLATHPRVAGNSQGVATIRVPAGARLLAVYRIGYTPWTDTIPVRQGYIDSVFIGLGVARMCFCCRTGSLQDGHRVTS